MDNKTLREYYRFLISHPAHKVQPDIDANARNFLLTAVENILEYLFGSTYTVQGAENRIKKVQADTEIEKYMISGGYRGLHNRLKLSRFIFLSNSYLAFYFGIWEYFSSELIEPAMSIAQRRPGNIKIIKEDIQKVINDDEEIKELYSASIKYKEEHRVLTESEGVKKICKALHLFYNCYSLSVASRRMQYAFLKAASRGNTALATLIKNFFLNRYQASKGIIRNPTPRYIDGPMSLSYHNSDRYSKRIYIFGELHGYKKDCLALNKKPSVNITNFLKQVFETTGRFIDLYLEYPAYESREMFRGGVQIHGYMSDMMDEFSNCIDPKKREYECKWRTARVHFSDIRFLQYVYGPVHKIDILGIKPELFYEPLTKNAEKIINFLTESIFKPEIFFKEFWKQLTGNPLIEKEFSRTFIEVRLIEDILKEFLPARLAPFAQEIKGIQLKVGTSLKKEQKRILSILTTNLQASFLDVYQLARMFKIFKESKERPSGQYNLISYSGDGHSDFFRFALVKLGFTTKFYLAEERKKRCLDMKGEVLDFSD